MTVTETWPDTEGGMRDWLRGYTAVSAIVGTRVFFGIPDEPTWPLIVVTRVAGTDDSSDAPVDHAVLQIDCWGSLFDDVDKTRSSHGDKAEADRLRRAVRQALYAINGPTDLNGTVVAYGASVESDPFIPDPDNARPRYAITARVTARAA